MTKDRGVFTPEEDIEWQYAAAELDQQSLINRLANAALKRAANESNRVVVLSNRFSDFDVLVTVSEDGADVKIAWLGVDKDIQDRQRWVGGQMDLDGEYLPPYMSYELRGEPEIDLLKGDIKPHNIARSLSHPISEVGQRLLNHIVQVTESGHVNQSLTENARQIALSSALVFGTA